MVATTANTHRVRMGRTARAKPITELTAADLMGRDGASITEDATLWEALERFLVHHTRHLAVVDRRRHYRGLLSDRHLVAQAPLDEQALRRHRVGDIGRLDRPSLAPGTAVAAVAQLLTEYEADAAPVVDEHGEVLGVVTRSAVVRALADHVPAESSASDLPRRVPRAPR